MTCSGSESYERRVEAVTAVEPSRLAELTELYRGEWWTATRTPDDVAKMLERSDLVFALIDRDRDRLVAFARVLTDHTYLAVVLDVIVAADSRRAGLGALLMEAILNHPQLANVQSVELVCQPELIPFYKRFGFSEHVGGSTLMRRTTDSRLLGRSTDAVT